MISITFSVFLDSKLLLTVSQSKYENSVYFIIYNLLGRIDGFMPFSIASVESEHKLSYLEFKFYLQIPFLACHVFLLYDKIQKTCMHRSYSHMENAFYIYIFFV